MGKSTSSRTRTYGEQERAKWSVRKTSLREEAEFGWRHGETVGGLVVGSQRLDATPKARLGTVLAECVQWKNTQKHCSKAAVTKQSSWLSYILQAK